VIGTTLSHFRIVAKIGEGGMGVVYRAEDTKLRREVALKVLPPDLVANEERRLRFLREARTAAAVNHPNIATIHEVDEADGVVFIAMELVEGKTLRDHMGAKPMAIKDSLRIATEMAEGLAKAHGAHVIHRDFKPDNVIVTADGHVKILDFGLAKLLEDPHEETPAEMSKLATLSREMTREGKIFGTPAYMSPEQIEARPVGVRSDLFSFGAVLYEMLSGHRAFGGDTNISTMTAILRDRPAPIRRARSDVPKGLEGILERCLQKSPEARYAMAGEVAGELRAVQSALSAATIPSDSLLRWLRRPVVAVSTILALLALIVTGVTIFRHYSKVRWAANEEIPAIERLLEEGDTTKNWTVFYEVAFRRVQEVQQYVPDDPRIPDLLEGCSTTLAIETAPPGADVYVRQYADRNGAWRVLGRTPLKEIRVPWATYRWRFEREGYETVESGQNTYSYSEEEKIQRTLDKADERPPGMVRVMGYDFESVGHVGDFYIDRLEVSNRQYKEFVDAGGYRNPRYWKHPFIKNGKVVSWEEAMAEFQDGTGRPGPSTWQASDYPDGRSEYPVTGVSWYEANAYAEFRGRSVPTVWHWKLATGEPLGFNGSGFLTSMYEASNFGGTGPAPVGSHQGMGGFGALDMAGNIREWNWNETEEGRCVAGGAWDDATYMYLDESQRPPWDRSPGNGFRCALYIDPEKIPQKTFEKHAFRPIRDYRKEEPVADSIFDVYRTQFAYDATELNAIVEERDDSAEDWVREKVTFDTAYPGERVIAQLFLPKNATPPFQTVIYYPGSNAVYTDKPLGAELREFKWNLAYLVKNGRAVMYPVYKGTYERAADQILEIHLPGEKYQHAHREYLIKWVKDFSRSVDYLTTRPDIDSEKLAYYGFSWGGLVGPVIMAVEERIAASILNLGGFASYSELPEVHGLNYAPRVRIPTLMLNGRYDQTFPLETDVMVLHDLLGTTEADKRLIVYDSDHFIPTKEKVKETLAWLDRYLGMVE
jgi:serine/threonine protein kinase/dienelactone hydrolase